MRVKRRVRSKVSCCERAQMSAVASVRRLACVTWNGSSAAGRIDTRKPNQKIFRQFGVFTNVFWRFTKVAASGNTEIASQRDRIFASKGKISYQYMFSCKKYFLSRLMYFCGVAFFIYYFCLVLNLSVFTTGI